MASREAIRAIFSSGDLSTGESDAPLPISIQLLLVIQSFTMSTVWFCLGSFIYAPIAIKIHDWAGEATDGILDFLSPLLGLALMIGPMLAVTAARESYRTRHRPMVGWWLSIPTAVALILTLVTLYDISYLLVWLIMKKGPTHLGEFVVIAQQYWGTSSRWAIPAVSLWRHMFLAVVLCTTVLLGFYGPLSDEAKQIVREASEVVNDVREGST